MARRRRRCSSPRQCRSRARALFEGLRAENGGFRSQADCAAVDYRIVDPHYEALIGDQFDVDPPRWLAVPEARILKRAENPVGRAVACSTPYTGILCFVLPSQV